MSENQKVQPPEPLSGPAAPPPPSRDRSPEARRQARRKKGAREQRIVTALNHGISMAEIAAREGVTLNRMRKVVRKALDQRMPQPPTQYLALQVNRLNEALIVASSAMYSEQTGANFKAIESVVRIVREMDRYHGFALPPAMPSRVEPARLPAPAGLPLALEAPILTRVGNDGASD